MNYHDFNISVTEMITKKVSLLNNQQLMVNKLFSSAVIPEYSIDRSIGPDDR